LLTTASAESVIAQPQPLPLPPVASSNDLKRRKTVLAIGLVTAVVTVAVGAAVLAGRSSNDGAVDDFRWDPTDFTVQLIVLEDECYGSAGGLVTFEPDLTVDSIEDWDTDATIVYEIRGGEDGAETHRIELKADGQYRYSEEIVGTAECGDRLTAEVVRVLSR